MAPPFVRLALGSVAFIGATVLGSLAEAAPPGVSAAVQKGQPLVIHVTVPLCSNEQIDCGAAWAGRPRDLVKNLYWGAVFGVRTWMERPRSDWERVAVAGELGARLERRVYRRWVSGAPFGRSERVEELVIFDAYAGDRIDEAVGAFWRLATCAAAPGAAGEDPCAVTFAEAGTERTVPVLVAGYAGHNRMLDGLALSAPPTVRKGGAQDGETSGPSRHALPSFVLACFSERTFGGPLREAGVPSLLTTSALVAPEAYLTDAVLHALGDGKEAGGVREAAIESYLKWQKLTRPAAGSMFVKTLPPG